MGSRLLTAVMGLHPLLEAAKGRIESALRTVATRCGGGVPAGGGMSRGSTEEAASHELRAGKKRRRARVHRSRTPYPGLWPQPEWETRVAQASLDRAVRRPIR